MTPGTARLLRIASVLSAAVPFAFALLAAWLPRHDTRFLWLAIAGFVGMMLVRQVAPNRGRGIGGALGMAAIVLVVALLLAAIIIRMMMSRLSAGSLFVALAFSLCFALSHALATLSAQADRSTTTPDATRA